MRSSRVQPRSPMRAAEVQKKSGALSSLPVASSLTASYWLPRGLASSITPVRPSLRASISTPA